YSSQGGTTFGSGNRGYGGHLDPDRVRFVRYDRDFDAQNYDRGYGAQGGGMQYGRGDTGYDTEYYRNNQNRGGAQGGTGGGYYGGGTAGARGNAGDWGDYGGGAYGDSGAFRGSSAGGIEPGRFFRGYGVGSGYRYSPY
ncbi:MAG TPA: hypothetical protein VK458_18715, partial [Myxococcaceae bacterium]|nr:hypothetical protein [Myxococcaceae bacterium]